MKEKKTYEPLLDIESVQAILSRITIFSGLSDSQLYTLFRLLSSVSYEANEAIFEQGTEPSHVYIVKSGKVKLVVWEQQIPLELVVFEEGTCFGEASVIGIQPHKGTAIALTHTELIVLSRDALLSIYNSDKELFGILILNIAREVCRRLHASDDVLLHYLLEK
ncbi:MAG: cyclic nucleotide-binding domain-containing protein [Sedimentisphaerales bacterium]|nr:cyclic nucleotide-binding domain-containing protein [Sedimentisphaerales bacterium]